MESWKNIANPIPEALPRNISNRLSNQALSHNDSISILAKVDDWPFGDSSRRWCCHRGQSGWGNRSILRRCGRPGASREIVLGRSCLITAAGTIPQSHGGYIVTWR